jgi:pimeloyl-ACP methyl ester carboxylesterase
MANFVLISGAGGIAWYWHRVVPLLEASGHVAVAVDLPGDDKRFLLSSYADRVIEVIRGRPVILVAQSLAGFTAALVCARVRQRMLTFVNSMIPVPGEPPGEWWGNQVRRPHERRAQRGGYGAEFDMATYFLHDVPPAIIKQGEAHQRQQADTVSGEPCRFEAWPDVPIHVIAGRDDWFFPIDFERRVAAESLHSTVDDVPGGHLVALANPEGLVQKLLRYLPPGER